MLLDVLTLALIINAQDQIAARQLLRELTHRTPDNVNTLCDTKNPVFEYQRLVVLRACKLAKPGGEKWLGDLF